MLSLSNSKLIQNLQILSDYIGRVDIGGDTSITIKSLENEAVGANDTLCILSGANSGIDINVDDFTDGVFDLGSNDNELSPRDTVAILSIPFDSYIIQAEKYIENELKNKGVKLENFLNEAQLEQLHIYKTLSLICGDRRNGSDLTDAYNSNFERFNSLYQTEFANFVADYDVDEDGIIQEDEQLVFKGQVGFVR